MKFKIDQNLPLESTALLAQAGHDAMTVFDQDLGGAPDERIVAICKEEGRILVTADLDLSDISRYPPQDSPGFIVLRARRQSKIALLALLERIIPLFGTHPLDGQLWIVEPDRVRIRNEFGGYQV